MAPLKFYTTFLFAIHASIGVIAITFDYRYYDNGGCDHNSAVNDTFPLNNSSALSSSSNECLSAPAGRNWNALELDNSISDGLSELITFCNVDCTGGSSSGQTNKNCFSPPPNCNIGSFSVTNINTSTPTTTTQFVLSTVATTVTIGQSEPTNTQNATSMEIPATEQSPSGEPNTDLNSTKTDIWEAVGGVFVGLTALCLLTLAMYYYVRRSKTKWKLATSPNTGTSVTPYNFDSLSAPTESEIAGRDSMYATSNTVTRNGNDTVPLNGFKFNRDSLKPSPNRYYTGQSATTLPDRTAATSPPPMYQTTTVIL